MARGQVTLKIKKNFRSPLLLMFGSIKSFLFNRTAFDHKIKQSEHKNRKDCLDLFVFVVVELKL